MNRELDEAVRRRAQYRCEYCLMYQSVRRLRFSIGHIIARQHGGTTTFENLALACPRCNRHKGANLTGIDPMTGRVVALFNPRIDPWLEHFRWQEAFVLGITPVGRATIVVLANEPCGGHCDPHRIDHATTVSACMRNKLEWHTTCNG